LKEFPTEIIPKGNHTVNFEQEYWKNLVEYLVFFGCRYRKRTLAISFSTSKYLDRAFFSFFDCLLSTQTKKSSWTENGAFIPFPLQTVSSFYLITRGWCQNILWYFSRRQIVMVKLTSPFILSFKFHHVATFTAKPTKTVCYSNH